MVYQLFSRMYDAAIVKIDRFTAGSFWAVKALVLIVLAAFMLNSFPSLSTLREADVTFEPIFQKADDLTYDVTDDYPPETNMAKQNFRLVIPILVSVFNLDQYGVYALQVLAGLGVLVMTLAISYRATQDRVSAFLVTLLVAFIWAGTTGLVETRAVVDALSILCLLIAIYFRNPFIIFAAIFVAGWNDERGLIGSSLVLVYYVITAPAPLASGSWLASFLSKLRSPQIIAILAAWVAYFVTRFAFAAAYDLGTVSIPLLRYIRFNIHWWPMAFWSAFEGGWIIVVAALAILLVSRRYLELTLFAGALLVITVVALSVVDISRSMAYALPGLFIGLHLLVSAENRDTQRVVIFLAALVAVIAPMYYFGDGTTWWFPFPIQIAEEILDLLV